MTVQIDVLGLALEHQLLYHIPSGIGPHSPFFLLEAGIGKSFMTLIWNLLTLVGFISWRIISHASCYYVLHSMLQLTKEYLV